VRDPGRLTKRFLVDVVKTIQNEVYFPSERFGVPVDMHQLLAHFNLHQVDVRHLPVPEIVYVKQRGKPIPALVDRRTGKYALVSKWFGFKGELSKPHRVHQSRILGPADPEDPEVLEMITAVWYPELGGRIIQRLRNENRLRQNANGLGEVHGEIYKHPAVYYQEIVDAVADEVPKMMEKKNETRFRASCSLALMALQRHPKPLFQLVEHFTHHPNEEAGPAAARILQSRESQEVAGALYSFARDIDAAAKEKGF
jgi:hypothetical protein